MKKIKWSLMFVLSLAVLASCGGKTSETATGSESNNSEETTEPVPVKESVEYIYNILVSDSIYEEIENSNQVSYQEVYENSNRVETITEDVQILNNQQTYYYGTTDVKYPETPSYNSNDSYIRKSEVQTINGTKLYFDVTDYEKQNEKDKATRLPIVASGDPSEDGLSYLLESSVDAQLCKQSSLFVAQFIDSYLINNIDLNGMIPAVYIQENSDKTTSYYLHDFSYNYAEEGLETTIIISFDIKLDTASNRLLSATTIYETKEEQGEDDFYQTKDTKTYEVSYGERGESVDQIIDVNDYFLSEVTKIQAYILDGEQKTYLDLNALPVGKYIRFEATTYQPSKAVDLMMYPVSSSKDFVTLDTETCYSDTIGTSLISFETATGVPFSQEITFVQSKLTGLTFSSTSDILEREYQEDYSVVYAVYNNTSYDSLYLSAEGGKFEKDDIVISYEHEGLLNFTIANQSDTSILYQLEVSDNNENIEYTSVTFSSKSTPNVKETIQFHLKKKLEGLALTQYMLDHVYEYQNIYTDLVYKIDFTSESEGIYYDNDGKTITEVPFTYTLEDYQLVIEFSADTYYAYDKEDMSIRRDGTQVSLFVGDGSYATHTYKAK